MLLLIISWSNMSVELGMERRIPGGMPLGLETSFAKIYSGTLPLSRQR